MDPQTSEYVAAPSPLLHGRTDRWAAVATEEGQLVLTTAGGRTLRCRPTIPVEGVLRLQIGDISRLPDPSPMLVAGLADTAADVRLVSGDAMITGPGVEVRWAPDGLRFGRYEPIQPFGRGVRLDDAGAVVGFLEGTALQPAAHVYGGGEVFTGPDLRGRLRHGVNVECSGAAGFDRAYLTVPFFWSDSGWGLFAHTGAPVTADVGATHGEIAVIDVPGPGLDLFVFSGDPVALLQRYLAVTGLPGRFPEWALGVWSSRCSYLSAAELEQVVDGYETADCPVDVVHVDAWVTGNVIKDLTCSWEVDRERFPRGWAQRLQARGVRASLWHNPYVLAGTAAGDELLAAGLVLRAAEGTVVGTNDMPERMVIDFTDPKAVAWWQERVTDTVRFEGNASFKPDFAEEIPPSAVTADGRTGWEVRNEYALRYQRATHEALQEVLGSDEIAMFCRSGTAGAQRYPCHWVGDTPSTWIGLVSALRAQLSLSLSGFGLVSSDIGGFYTPDAFAHTADAFEAMDPQSYRADVDPELFVRWTQFGALSPVMRFHGTGRREPWSYPEPYAAAAVEACRLRKKMRGYLKAAADVAAATGLPMMQPMALAFPDDRAAQAAQLQYLLGPDLLVAPVLAPGGRVEVYLPAGRWEPVAGLAALEGSGWTEVDVPLTAIPAWRRA